MKLYLLLFTLVFSLTTLSGQSSEAYFKALTSENGLTENHANCIYQDETGYMWFGTFDGLNRYDGYEITTFKPDPNDAESLSSILIFAITGDKHGNLWIGTTGGGLNYYDSSTGKFTVFRADESDPNSISNDIIQSLFVDSKDRLWVGTNNGVNLLHLEDWSPEKPALFSRISIGEPNQNNQVIDIFEDKDDNIWLASNRSLNKVTFVEESWKVEAVYRNKTRIFTGVQSIIQLPEGQMVVSNPNGIFLQNKNGEEWTNVSSEPGNHLAIDSTKNSLWVGSLNGLRRYYLSEGLSQPAETYKNNPSDINSLTNNSIEDLYVDKNGLVWIGTFGGGVNYYDPNRKKFKLLNVRDSGSSLSSNSVRSLNQDKDGRLWIGTIGGGTDVTQAAFGSDTEAQFRRINTPSRVYATMEVISDSDHYVYLGAGDNPGLYRVNLNDENWPVEPVAGFAHAVFSMHQDQRGILWFGTYAGGLSRWIPDESEPSGYKITKFLQTGNQSNLPSNIIRSITEDLDGNLWFGTAKGLVRLKSSAAREDNPIFETFINEPGNSSSLSHDYILSLRVAPDNTLWVGTFGGGLNHLTSFSEEGIPNFEQFTELEGFPNGVIKAILIDNDHDIWASTNKGIVHLDAKSKQLTTYDYGDGLQSNEFQELAACRLSDGTLVFGGVKGVNYFHPNDIHVDQSTVKPVLTGLEVLNIPVVQGASINGKVILEESLEQTSNINLRHTENNFSIEFSALQFESPNDIRYAYQLEGFNEDWIYTDSDHRRATYTNLPYQDYVFRVKASNSDGVWSEEFKTLNISISPPIWLEWYAKVFYALLFVLMLYAFRKFSLIDVKEKNRLMIEQVSQDKIRELNQLKLQFFTNISHELRTPLTLITGPLENMIQTSKTITEDQRNKYHHLMYKNAKYLLRLVDQLLDFRKLDQGATPLQLEKRDVVKFLRDITSPFDFLASKKNLTFHFLPEEEPLTAWFDPAIMEKILYNLLSNAFKFTPEGGSVTVRVRKSMGKKSSTPEKFRRYGSVAISVEDSGVGINKNKIKSIFDRFYTSSSGEVKNREGAGIGLSYTWELVELHRGKIDVESSPGKGSVFTVRITLDKNQYESNEFRTESTHNYLPQYDPEDFIGTSSESSAEELELNSEVTELQQRNMLMAEREDSPLLLYIDDNADLRSFIRKGMESDFRVVAADGGRAGIELATTAVPDFIITDLMMPDVDGMQVLKEIKNDPRTSHIPVIMLTAKDTAESRTEGLGYGADGYQTKPFDIGDLTQQIKNILNSRTQLHERFRKQVITSPKEVTVTNVDEEFLQRAMDIVEENMGNTEFSVEELVREMRVSRSKLYLKLKALTGQSSSEFVRTIRLKRAVQLLENSGYSVKEVMFMTGFNTASYFSKCFKQQFGIVPSEYIRLHKEKAKNKETGEG